MLHLTWTVFTVIYNKVPGVGPRKGSIHIVEHVSKQPVDMLPQELANVTVSIYVAKHPLSLNNSVGNRTNNGECDSLDNENEPHDWPIRTSRFFFLGGIHFPSHTMQHHAIMFEQDFFFVNRGTLLVARILTTQVRFFFFCSTCAFIVMFTRQYSGSELRKVPERLVQHVKL